jgi:glycosyltransferase involved in cell wall biosynthesis
MGQLSDRPTVTVVVPFAGSDEQLRELRGALAGLTPRPGDEVIVSDNRRDPVRTPAYARNRGASGATGDWLVFIDADTRADDDLLDAYFDPPPEARTGVLAGSIRDVARRPTAVALSGVAHARMSQRHTLERRGTPYAQTANCAIRRDAFEAVQGFNERARAGEDADLCFRLQRAGWRIEERPGASVEHRSRETLPGWLAQMLRHGSGAAWVERRWPGELPPAGAGRLARRVARDGADATNAALRGDRVAITDAILDALGASAFELGRMLPNAHGGGLRG